MRPARGTSGPLRDKVRPAEARQRRFREKTRPAEARQRRFREKTRPAGVETTNVERFERAGRTFSRLRLKHAEQGELSRAQPSATTQL